MKKGWDIPTENYYSKFLPLLKLLEAKQFKP